MNINGFEIETYNYYNLPENTKSSTCPLCSENRKKKKDKCMSLYWDRGIGVCHHCGELIQLHTFKKKANTNARKYSRPVWNNNTELPDNVVKWFEGRGISQFVLRRANVTHTSANMPPDWKLMKTICFNYFRGGELINIKYRSADKRFLLHKNGELIMYNLDHCALSEDIIICEGEMDVLSFMQAGLYHVTSVPNGSTLKTVNLEYLDNCIEYFENKKRIYLALDKDEAGQNVTRELVRRFGTEKCLMVDFGDCKDANEYLLKYGWQALRQCIDDAKPIPIEGVSSANDWKDELTDYLLNGMKQGYVTGIQSFDNIFSTYCGQYIVVTGKPSSGKSDFVDMMCLGYYQNYGWKTAIASTENKPNFIHAGKILSKLFGSWVNNEAVIKSDWYNNAVEELNNVFKYIDLDGAYDLEAVLDKARSLILRFGIKVLVIDPFNKIRLKSSLHKNINEYSNDYLIMIDEFARKHDVLILLVAHPRKPQGDAGKNYEPDFYDIKGGGEFYDMSPHGILVHRDYEHDLVKVKVLKVKFHHLGKNDAHVWLKWNGSNGRYIDFLDQHDDPTRVSNPVVDNKPLVYCN